MRALAVTLLSFAVVACAAPPLPATPSPASTLTGTPALSPTAAPGPAVDVPPSPSASVALDCGPLAAASCAKAVAAALSVLPATHPPVLTVRVELPTALMTCPPGGGPAPRGTTCTLLVALTTSAGQSLVPLIATTDGGWFPTQLMF